jgi:hypothetical protein
MGRRAKPWRRMVYPTRGKWFKWRVAAYVIVGIFLFSSAAVLVGWNFYAFRTAAKWTLSSNSYKSEVLAEAPPSRGEFKHIKWDGWGWGGQDTTVYLVFDPENILATAANGHQAGKFNGLPCEVPVVSRLENEWYTVQFYTNEFWGRRNALNCGAA